MSVPALSPPHDSGLPSSGDVRGQMNSGLQAQIRDLEAYHNNRRGLPLAPSAHVPPGGADPIHLRPVRGPASRENAITQFFELHKWAGFHLRTRIPTYDLPTKSAFLKHFVCTTITTTILAKAFFAAFNPWVTAILVFGHILQNRIVHELFHNFADSASGLRRTRDAQNFSLEGLLYAATLIAFGVLACLSLNLRLTTFATYYLFTVVSEKLTFGILNAVAYWCSHEPGVSIDRQNVQARRIV